MVARRGEHYIRTMKTEDSYQRRREVSSCWFNKASDLHAASAAIWFSMEDEQSHLIVKKFRLGRGFRMDAAVRSVFCMTCGLALELLYKAIAVENKSFTPDKDTHHRLVDLGKKAGVKLAADDEDLLEILSEYIYWEGKYPAPKPNQPTQRLHKLKSRCLFEEISIGKLKIKKPNGRLSWDGFESLWQSGVLLYYRANGMI